MPWLRFSLRTLLIALPVVVAILGFGANLGYNNLTEIPLPAVVQAQREAIAADLEPRLCADGYLSPKVFIGG